MMGKQIGVVEVTVSYESSEGRREVITQATPVGDDDNINARMCVMAMLALNRFVSADTGLVSINFHDRPA